MFPSVRHPGATLTQECWAQPTSQGPPCPKPALRGALEKQSGMPTVTTRGHCWAQDPTQPPPVSQALSQAHLPRAATLHLGEAPMRVSLASSQSPFPVPQPMAQWRVGLSPSPGLRSSDSWPSRWSHGLC